MTDAELRDWLAAKPLNTLCEVCSERVYLNSSRTGAELGAILANAEQFTPAQLQPMLEQSYSNALMFDAGLAISANGRDLLLTQWLPGVTSWVAAGPALEQLLNQLEVCRAALPDFSSASSNSTAAKPAVKPASVQAGDRAQQRLRMLFAESKS